MRTLTTAGPAVWATAAIVPGAARGGGHDGRMRRELRAGADRRQDDTAAKDDAATSAPERRR